MNKMLLKLLCISVVTSFCVCDVFDVNYIDTVVNYLLNGNSSEILELEETDADVDPVLSGGIWKCGKCNNINESALVYFDSMRLEDDQIADSSDDIQIGFDLPGMQCVMVQSDTPGVVRHVTGDCTSGQVTLNVTPVAYLTVRVYN